MPLNRRDFMKVFGVSVASLFINRACVPGGCYAPMPLTATPPPTGGSSARERLRRYWLRFGELAEKSRQDTDNKLGQELYAGHRAELDELVASGEISAPVANLVQEAYGAAVQHVWRSNAPITCYEPAWVDYTPTSAGVLVEQSQVLSQIAAEGTIDPATLAKAQAALEHDLSFYALTDVEMEALYSQISKDYSETGQQPPSFEELSLELTPEAQEAAQFIIDMLTEK